MIKELLRRIFTTKNKEIASIASHNPNSIEFYYVKDYDMTNLNSHIKQIVKILDIKLPEIYLIPYMADYGGNHLVMDNFNAEIPVEYYEMGYYHDDINVIHVSIYYPPTRQLMHESMILTTICHELRHVWQNTYKAEEYYSKPNALGATECIMDKAEIDADAFTMAYMKAKTNYNSEDYNEQINLYCQYDNGKRKNRARIIKNTYFK